MVCSRNILAIIGSASSNSSNLRLVQTIAALSANSLNIEIFEGLQSLPHFNADLSVNQPPEAVRLIRQKIEKADGIIICTPEYVFSIPSGLKNLLEWCVATTIFAQKPTGLITASASGEKGHHELTLIMKTIEAKFTEETSLLINGIKSKIDLDGNLQEALKNQLVQFINSLKNLVDEAPGHQPF
ncbi:MAG: NAD(P)H-dependent oxidoreductase [Sphingobacteriia bacterium]|nr:NAD(P)H-dependent oxidoreductase [Sphingobacteriia bacterium]